MLTNPGENESIAKSDARIPHAILVSAPREAALKRRKMMLGSVLTRRTLWLIARRRLGRMEVLTITPTPDGEALPVFSFEDEAQLFLWLQMSGTSWQARKTTPGELISVLYGPCAGVEKVALDPPAEITGKAMVALVSLSRKECIRTLVSEGEPAKPRRSSLLARAPFNSISA